MESESAELLTSASSVSRKHPYYPMPRVGKSGPTEAGPNTLLPLFDCLLEKILLGNPVNFPGF